MQNVWSWIRFLSLAIQIVVDSWILQSMKTYKTSSNIFSVRIYFSGAPCSLICHEEKNM